MIKFILGAAIVCFTSFCGYVFAKKYRRRKNFFAQMNEFNERFLSEIAYYRRPVEEFAGRYEYKGDFEILLSSFLDSLGEEDAGPFPVFFLPDGGRNGVRERLFSHGRQRGQRVAERLFHLCEGTLGEYRKKSADECRRYGDLYLKLGFLFGLMILVLIV